MKKIYDYKETLDNCVEYFGNELSAKACVDKYLLRNNSNELLEHTPTDLIARIAKEITRIESKKFKNPLSYNEVFSYLKDFAKIIPQGSPLYGIGNKEQYVSLSNCFVLHQPDDSYGGIMYVDEQLVQISKRRGGVGISLDKLRPNGSPTQNSSRTSTGIVSWMERYSNSIREVGQCVKYDQRVLTQSGLKPIQDVKDFEMVWTKEGWTLVNKVVKTGSKKVYRVTTDTGYSVETSLDHVYQTFTIEGELAETKLRDLKAGDRIVLCLGEGLNTANDVALDSDNKPANCVLPSRLDEKLAYLLGYSYGDGHSNRALEFVCSDDYPVVKEKLIQYCQDVFDYQIKRKPGDGKLEVLGIYNKTIVNFLQHNKLLKEKSGQIIFPDKIAQSKPEVQAAFIAGYFDADDHASGPNLEFLRNIQTILSTLGILSKIHFEDRSTQGWSLCIVGSVSQREVCEVFSHSIKIKKENYNVCTRLVQDCIQSIEYIGEYECYDLMLDKEHLFWCEGIYIHNSGRRGALMLTLNVHHPQILDFITAKNNQGKVTGANISVQYTDEFLKAVENDEEYEQRWPIDSQTPEISIMVKARDIWKAAVHNAWACAEPGLQFIDNVLKESPADCYSDVGFKTISSNPCSEIFLSELDSCRLLIKNLFAYVINAFKNEAYFDFDALYDDAIIAQRMMDNIVDLELECINRILKKIKDDPEDEEIKKNELDTWQKVKQACENGRRTGLGATALADAMAALNIKYGSIESINFTEQVYKTIKLAAYRSSVDMAKELGPFPVWDVEKEKNNPFLLRIKDEDPNLYRDMQKYGRRNIAILTSAPTGTTSMIASLSCNNKKLHGTTSGIEPLFQISMTRRKKGNPGDNNFRSDFVDQSGDHWMEFDVYHPGVTLWMEVTGNSDVTQSPYYGACANDIDWLNRVRLQAAAQRHIDHSISSTINLPENISEDIVEMIYLESWRSGCKGATVYRQGCRTGVLIEKKLGITKVKAIKRPDKLECDVHHITVKGQPYFVLVGIYDGDPYEVFAGKNGCIDKKIKKGIIVKQKRKRYKLILEDETELSPINAFIDQDEEIIARMLSLSLRHGIDPSFLVHQFEKSSGTLDSFSKSIVRALKKYIPDGTTVHGEECPECGSDLKRQEGCLHCPSCGWGKC